jgi:hypothetical protein
MGGLSPVPPMRATTFGAFVEWHHLALEAGSGQQARQIFRARRLLAGWVDRIEADQLGGEIDGTK